MALLSIKTFEAHDGNEDGLIQLVRDARDTMLKVDPNRTVRIFQVLEGPQAGQVSIMIEYPDLEAFRAIRAKEQADPDWQQIGERANGAARPAETLSYFQMAEIE